MKSNAKEFLEKSEISPHFIREQIKDWLDYKKAKQQILRVNETLLRHKIVDLDQINLIQNELDLKFLEKNQYIVNSVLFRIARELGINISITHQRFLGANIDESVRPFNKKLQSLVEQQQLPCFLVYDSTNLDISSKDVKYQQPQFFELYKQHANQPKDDLRLQLFFESKHFINDLGKRNYQAYLSDQKDSEFYEKVILQYEVNINQLKDIIHNTSQLIIILEPHTKGIEKKEQMTSFINFNKNDFEVIKLIFKASDSYTYQILEQDLEPENKRAAVLNYVEQNPEKIIEYILGAKLDQPSDMIFSALRVLAIRAFQAGEVKSYDSKVTVKTSDLWKLCNLKPRSDGGYESHQKAEIKELLRSDGKLQTKMMYEHGKSYVITSFVLNLHWNEDRTVTFQMDSIFFVAGSKLSYFYEDIEGRNRVVSEMPRDKYAYKLHKYLCYAFKSKKQSFNVSTLARTMDKEL